MAAPVFGQRVPTKGKNGATKDGSNPMLALGPGPEGTTCKHCESLRVNQVAHRYYKCARRGMSASAATDHRQNWPACMFYTEAS